MKKFLSLFAVILFAGSMMAQTPKVTLDFTDAGWGFPTDYVTDATDYTNGDYTINVNAANGHKVVLVSTSDPSQGIKALLFGKSGATITLPAMSFNVSKIKVKGESGASGKVTFNIFVGSNAVSTEAKSSKEDHDFAIVSDKQAAGTVYVIKVTNANNCQVSAVEFYEAVSGAPENPTFSVAEGAYLEAQSVELACATEGAAIHYTLDGSTPDEGSDVYSAALAITETTTVKAIAIKAGVSSDVVSATYTILEGLTGDGTKEKPFTVADLAIINNGLAGKYWVKGYIVGCAANGGVKAEEVAESNIALGDAADQTEGLAPVQLPTGDIRTALNIKDNEGNVGKLVKVHGTLESYFLTTGIKNTDDYEFDSSTAIDNTDAEVKAEKFFRNGQLIIRKNGVEYNALGTQL